MSHNRDFEVLVGAKYRQIPYEAFARQADRFWDFGFFDHLVNVHEKPVCFTMDTFIRCFDKTPLPQWSQELCGHFMFLSNTRFTIVIYKQKLDFSRYPPSHFPNTIDRFLCNTLIAPLWWIYSMVSLLILINPYCLTLSIDHRCRVPFKGSL